jgi:hypothetical protein
MKSNKILYVLIPIALFLGYVMLKYYIRTDYKKEETDSKTVFIAIIAVGLIWRYVIEPYIIDNPKTRPMQFLFKAK